MLQLDLNYKQCKECDLNVCVYTCSFIRSFVRVSVCPQTELIKSLTKRFVSIGKWK